MPQRLLRPAIRQSKRWNRLGYLEQSLYIRLFTLVDDYGRYDADPELIRSECFPYGDPNGRPVPVPTIDQGLRTIASKDMCVLYEVDGKRYLQLSRWQERARSESRWPDPKKGEMLTFANNCQQMIASPPSPSPSPSLAGTAMPVGKPSKEEVDLYAAKIGLPQTEADKFWNYYEANGWKVGRNPMRSWQAAMRNWKLNSQSYGNSNHSKGPQQRIDRNIGTANEGRASQYKGMGRVAPVQDPQRPTT